MKDITIKVPDWYNEAVVEIEVTMTPRPKTLDEQMRYLHSVSERREKQFRRDAKKENKDMNDFLPAVGAMATIGTLAWHVGMVKTGNYRKSNSGGWNKVFSYKWDCNPKVKMTPYTDEEMQGFVDELDEIEEAATKFLRFFTSVVAFELIGKYGFDNPWEEGK